MLKLWFCKLVYHCPAWWKIVKSRISGFGQIWKIGFLHSSNNNGNKLKVIVNKNKHFICIILAECNCQLVPLFRANGTFSSILYYSYLIKAIFGRHSRIVYYTYTVRHTEKLTHDLKVLVRLAKWKATDSQMIKLSYSHNNGAIFDRHIWRRG